MASTTLVDEGSSSQDPHFPDLGQKTYLRCTIGKWKVDLDSEEVQEAFRLISDEGLLALRSQPAFISYRLMIADPTTTIAVAEWENAYSETFISRFSDELLKREVFADLLEAKVLVEDYRGHYNHNRPHSALGYKTTVEFAVAADLDMKVEDRGKPEKLESVLTLS